MAIAYAMYNTTD